MQLLISLVILISLIKILNQTSRPMLCAGIYVAINFFFSLLFEQPLIPLIIGSVISFGYFYGWFWLLDKSEGSKWVLVLIGGIIFPPILNTILGSIG